MFGVFLFCLFFLAGCWLVTPRPQPAVAAYDPLAAYEPLLPTVEELVAEAEAIVAKPVYSSAAVSAPVAVVVVPVAEPPLEQKTAVQLRRVCAERGIRWRNVHGKGKHLSKREMLTALA